jgi:hypothetical protein
MFNSLFFISVVQGVTTFDPMGLSTLGDFKTSSGDEQRCLRLYGCRFHWPQSWARASLTSTSSPPTLGPGVDAVLTMR